MPHELIREEIRQWSPQAHRVGLRIQNIILERVGASRKFRTELSYVFCLPSTLTTSLGSSSVSAAGALANSSSSSGTGFHTASELSSSEGISRRFLWATLSSSSLQLWLSWEKYTPRSAVTVVSSTSSVLTYKVGRWLCTTARPRPPRFTVERIVERVGWAGSQTKNGTQKILDCD
jgi:hypothetical protein